MAAQSGGAFLPSDPATITGLWTFTQQPQTPGLNPGSTPLISTVSQSDSSFGPMHQTTITLSGLAMSISDSHVGGGSKIFTFPVGLIAVIGATASVAETTTSVLASTLKASKTLSVGVGSVQTTTQDSGTLVTTQQDFVNAFAATSSATVNVPGAAATGITSATTMLKFDGTATAIAVWLNCGVPTAGDIDADATTTWSGTVVLTWMFLGDV